MAASSLLPESIPEADLGRNEQERRRAERLAEYHHLGFPKTRVCALLGITGPTYERLLGSEIVQARVAELSVNAQERVLMLRLRLEQAAEQALEGLIAQTLDPSCPHATRAQIRMDLLDREGSIPRKVEARAPDSKPLISDEQFERFLGVLSESTRAIDVTPSTGGARPTPGAAPEIDA